MAFSSGYSWSADRTLCDHTSKFEAYFCGRTFSSYCEFEEALKKFQEECLVTFRVRSSQLSAPGDPCVYRQMTLMCAYGDFDEQGESIGIRKRRRINRGCRARFSLNERDGVLVVEARNRMLVHNHRCSETSCRLDLGTRQLTSEERKKVMHFLLYGTPADRIRSMVRREYKKNLTHQDINNIKCQLIDKTVPAGSWSELEALVHEDGDFSCTRDEEGRIECISFRRTEQAKLFEQYPEVVCIDITYNVNRDRFCLLQFVITDGLGHGRCVMYSLMRNVRRGTYVTALSHFRDLMPNATKVRTFVVDLSFAQISAIQTIFREQKILICQSHMVRAIHRESDDRLLWHFMRCLMRTTSIARFRAMCLRLRRNYPRFYVYLCRTWLKHAHRWAVCYLSGTVCLGNLMKNRAESVHRWLKQDLYAGYSLFNCCKRLWLSSHFMLVDYRSEVLLSRVGRPMVSFNNPLSGVVYALTRYAAKLMLREWDSSNNPMSVFAVGGSLKVIEQASSRWLTYKVDVQKRFCSCFFHQLYAMPCRHLVFACLETKVPMEYLLVDSRWLDVNLNVVEILKLKLAHPRRPHKRVSNVDALERRTLRLHHILPARIFRGMMLEMSTIVDEFEKEAENDGATSSDSLQDEISPARQRTSQMVATDSPMTTTMRQQETIKLTRAQSPEVVIRTLKVPTLRKVTRQRSLLVGMDEENKENAPIPSTSYSSTPR